MTWLVSVLAAALTSVEAPPPDVIPSSATTANDGDGEQAPPTFAGEFRFAGGERERSRVAAAIEKAVLALLPIFHDLARERLGRANQIPGEVVMRMHGDELEIVYGDLPPMRAPLDGSVRHWHNREGTKVKLTHELRGDTLVQTTWGGGGRRVMKWTLVDGGRRLRVHSVMSSPSLPVDIEYRLTFHR